jgi:hypothetical protein
MTSEARRKILEHALAGARMTGEERTTAAAKEVTCAFSAEIAPLLHGRGPEIQGAVLADLFATYLAGHQGPDAVEVREQVIALWLELVRDLVPIAEGKILARLAEAGKMH